MRKFLAILLLACSLLLTGLPVSARADKPDNPGKSEEHTSPAPTSTTPSSAPSSPSSTGSSSSTTAAPTPGSSSTGSSTSDSSGQGGSAPTPAPTAQSTGPKPTSAPIAGNTSSSSSGAMETSTPHSSSETTSTNSSSNNHTSSSESSSNTSQTSSVSTQNTSNSESVKTAPVDTVPNKAEKSLDKAVPQVLSAATSAARTIPVVSTVLNAGSRLISGPLGLITRNKPFQYKNEDVVSPATTAGLSSLASFLIAGGLVLLVLPQRFFKIPRFISKRSYA